MAELINDTAKAAGVAAILNTGDTTMRGTEAEKYCVDAINKARPAGIPMIVVDGNHDSPAITKFESAKGQDILMGDIFEIDGVRILGESSPAATHLGAGLNPKPEWITALGRELRDKACADGNVDLLMVHEPQTGDATMHSGCVPLQISGHTHKRYDPFQTGKSVRYVNASTAGAMPNKLTVGPLQGTAEMTVLRFDPSENRFIDWRLIQVHPNGTAEVGDFQPIILPSDEASATRAVNFDVSHPGKMTPPASPEATEDPQVVTVIDPHEPDDA
jgi:predicted phosphodiesterase